MSRSPNLLTVFLLMVVGLLGAVATGQAQTVKSSQLDLTAGYRVDELNWTIAGQLAGTNPNILSELKWTDLQSTQLQIDAQLLTRDLLYLKTDTLWLGTIAFGKIYSGKNRDSDYAGDNRTLEWSRSVNQSDDGFTVDLSGAVGPEFSFREGRLSLAPLVGYSFHMQDVFITDGTQTVSDDALHDTVFNPAEGPAPLGPITGLDSSYTAYWYGPWLGVNVNYEPAENWHISFSGSYHIVEYFAEADWNLRSNLAHPVSFEHEADGTGTVFSLKIVHDLSDRWSLVVSTKTQDWKTGNGVDTTYFANGSRGATRLNEVRWSSYAVMTGLRFEF